MQKTLRLPIKKVWFDMIKAGIKLEEYRGLKPYWEDRIQRVSGMKLPDNQCKPFDQVEFINGYGKSAPRILVECLGIEIGCGKVSWGAIEGEVYFVIKLGKIIPDAAQ